MMAHVMTFDVNQEHYQNQVTFNSIQYKLHSRPLVMEH